ncbi:MAG: stage III sporulation protein AE [Peptococcaceae bacterium]|nr:stage III sporulation protein AE [Peptococcaceae bacterium]
MPHLKLRVILFCLVWTSCLIACVPSAQAAVSAPASDSFSLPNISEPNMPAPNTSLPDITLPSTSPSSTPQALDSVDLSKLQDFMRSMDQETLSYFPQLDLTNLMTKIKEGKVDFRPQSILAGIVQLLFKEVAASAGLMGKLVILAVLVGVLQHLQTAFDGSVGKVAQTMSYLVLISIAITSLTLAMNTGKGAIDSMVGFMQALLPVLMTLMVALGNLSTAAMFHPFILASLSFISSIIKDIVFPLVFLGAVLVVVNLVSDRFKVSKLATLLNSAGKVVLGLSLTVFIGIMTIEGAVGSIGDGVALRSAKFATDAFVPVVGRWFSDAVEMVVGSALLLKNAIGIVGVVVILLLCLLPVVKILAIMIIYRVAAAVTQPLGNSELADALQAMSSSLTLVFACVASVALMFLLAVFIILATGNMTVMLR